MEENTIKFALEKGYFLCENEVFKLPLGPIDKLIYIALIRYAGSNNRAWPSYNRLAEDAGIGKKRAIEAVKTLSGCHLIEKSSRSNSSNIYLVYPPKYYCNGKDEDLAIVNEQKGGVHRTPLKPKVVSIEHPGGVQGTPEECSENTQGVSTGHPIINSINNKKSNNSSKKQEEERNLFLQKEIIAKDVEVINEIFNEKGYEVSDLVIEEMIAKYSFEEVKAAVSCTNFEMAKNPIAVIYSLLRSGRYVKPTKKRGPKEYEHEEPSADIDPETVKNYFQGIKNVLENTPKEMVGKGG